MYYTKVSGFSGKKSLALKWYYPPSPIPLARPATETRLPYAVTTLTHWPGHTALCLTVQKISSLGLIYYFSQISSVLFHCLLPSSKEHNCISMSKLINCRMETDVDLLKLLVYFAFNFALALYGEENSSLCFN